MRISVKPVDETSGPFEYVYISISEIPGLRLPENFKENLQVCDFPELGAKCFITTDPEPYRYHIDRNDAIGTLLFTGLRGVRRFKKFSGYVDYFLAFLFSESWVFNRNLDRETNSSRERRYKNNRNPGCYFIYKATGELIQPAILTNARRVESFGYGIDVIVGGIYRDRHKQAMHSAKTALSLTLESENIPSNIHLVDDIVYLQGKNDLKIYCKKIIGGGVGVVTTSIANVEKIDTAGRYVSKLMDDPQLATAVSLFSQSQIKSYDNLRSFIAAWSSLELLINRLSKIHSNSWEARIENDFQSLPEWDRELIGIPLNEYRLRDRFFLVSNTLSSESVEVDIQMFSNINNKRSGFYHRLSIDEKHLPTHDVRTLFRKYLKLELDYRQ